MSAFEDEDATYEVTIMVRENGRPFVNFAPLVLRKNMTRGDMATILEAWEELFNA